MPGHERARLRFDGVMSMKSTMRMRGTTAALVATLGAGMFATATHAAGPILLAMSTISGFYEDFATQTSDPLENGVRGNRLGGMGSGLAYMGGDWFLALPDRGPNAVSFNSCDDDTVAYINRFHTLHLSLSPSDPGSTPLPFTLTPMVVDTTLLSSREKLVYGQGCGVEGSGEPALNDQDHTHYFTGRSDGFDPSQPSTYPFDARFDSESIRVSNDLHHVYISDEYGPYVYEFDRLTGERTKIYNMPKKFAVPFPNAQGAVEISGNITGRVANKGMEGLAITPDGKTLVGAMQSPLIEDGGDNLGGVTRIITIDVNNGKTHEYAYQLDTGTKTTVSDILAVNNHQFLVDERDSKGLADNSVAKFKQLYLIDLAGATDISNLVGQANIAPHAVAKTLFLDVVAVLKLNGMNASDIPAKLEGVAFGQDVVYQNKPMHTIYVANDNDYLAVTPNSATGNTSNPNRWFVFGFTDTDLPGFIPQQFKDNDKDKDKDR